MKPILLILAIFATLNGQAAQPKKNAPTGSAAQGASCDANGFQLGIGLGALATLGAIIGVTASSSTHSHSSH